ncbi:RfaL Lipid A core - O-antigen ligase and related enzymes [Oxalobacteraceae bacterium]
MSLLSNKNGSEIFGIFTRQQSVSLIFSILPITLFFPIGIMYTVIVLYFIAWLAAGALREKWAEIRRHPVYTANFVLLAIVLLSAILLSSGNDYRWHGIIHYLVFIFLLLFSVGCEDTVHRRAKLSLFVGALYAGMVFCFAKLGWLPDWTVFSYYHQYAGNKSISLGIFMAITAAWMLNEAFDASERRTMLAYLVAYAFTEWVVVQFAVTRTGTLMVYLLSALVILRRFKFNPRSLVIAAAVTVVIIGVISSNGDGNRRLQGVGTAITALQDGSAVTGESNRLQFLRVTGAMIAEKPFIGFGIGGWRQEYPVRAQGLETAFMSTPHNDYLLYGSELGVIGLILLAWIFGGLVRESLRTKSTKSTALLLVIVALVVSSMFNAMLRDWRFGVPLMLMIAIAYRDSRAISPNPDGEPSVSASAIDNDSSEMPK